MTSEAFTVFMDACEDEIKKRLVTKPEKYRSICFHKATEENLSVCYDVVVGYLCFSIEYLIEFNNSSSNMVMIKSFKDD